MKILVCMSNVPDTTTKIRFRDDNTRFDDSGVQWIINPWDELALTRALEIREKSGGAVTSVSVANVGPAGTEPTIRKALAIGADSAFRINAEPKDAYYIATQLAEVVKSEQFDIVLCGIESSDYNNSAVGGMLAELLDAPSVSSVSFLDIENGQVVVKREIDGGKETIGVRTPFVAVVQKGIAFDPRIPNMRGIMMARQKPLKVVEPVAADPLTEYISYVTPEAKAACRLVDAENVKELVHLLHTEAKVI
ncbi:MAG: electron transfer flavoprotein subunit beta/FixA family protein [Bacteroidetes bacterium]|nr:electron transfer flavoprotein subunit beta/FixA family protein [Bacteroidota bacterium]